MQYPLDSFADLNILIDQDSNMFNLVASRQQHISIDCIKACPYEKNIFAFAYYQTNPSTLGAIAVAKINTPDDFQSFKPIQCPPLLHITWSKAIHNPNIYILAAASRKDDVLIYFYEPHTQKLTLQKILKIGSQVFCLYLDLLAYENHYKMVVSSNQSTVTDITLDLAFEIVDQNIYSKHQYSVWTCRIDPNHPNTFACGDEVNSIYIYSEGKLIAKNSKAHKGGICDLTYHKQNILYSGGFDGIVCSFDTRKFDTCVQQHEWGGTIWRVIPNQKNEIIVCNSSEKLFQIVDETLHKQLWNSGKDHDSLAYAADWGEQSLLTSSFYDKKLCLWSRQQ